MAGEGLPVQTATRVLGVSGGAGGAGGRGGCAGGGGRRTVRGLGHVIDEGVLFLKIPAPVPAERHGRLHRARLAAVSPIAAPGPVRVQRRVSGGGVTQVVGQTLRVGHAHRNTVTDVEVHGTEFHLCDHAGEPLAVITRTSAKEVSRYKAYGWSNRNG